MTQKSKRIKKTERGDIISSSKLSLPLKLKMEGELDTQELKYSMDLDSSSENDDNSSESSKFQEDFLDIQELSYSVDLRDLTENDQSESDENIPKLCLLKPYDFEPLVKKFKIIRIFKLQRQQLNVLVIQIGVSVGLSTTGTPFLQNTSR